MGAFSDTLVASVDTGKAFDRLACTECFCRICEAADLNCIPMLPPIRLPLTPKDLWLSARIDTPDDPEILERAFAAHFGFPYGVLFPYARIALYMLITAFGWRQQKILCPAYTCAVVPLAVTVSGNTVQFVDCASDHFLPGVAQWADRLTPDTKLMIVTPLYGYPVDKNSEVLARTIAPNIFVLYDEAQSLGAADSSGFQARDADGALLSLGPGKMLSALSGGLLLLRDETLYRTVRALRDAQCTTSTSRDVTRRFASGFVRWAALQEPLFSSLLYAQRFIPALSPEHISTRELIETKFPVDMLVLPSSYEVRIALRQLNRLNLLTAARRRVAEYYDHRLQEEGFTTFFHSATPTFTRYPFAVSDRTTIIRFFAREKIQLGWFIRYSCEQASATTASSASCPNALRWARSMINLPNFQGVSIADAERCLGLLLRLRDQRENASAWPATVS
jgi:perosamine synthetase